MDAFTALSIPSRRNIIELLAKCGTLSATAIYEHFTITKPAISQHLKVLRSAKLVQMEKKGKQRLYGVDLEGMKLLEQWSLDMTTLWNHRLDALDTVIKNNKE